MDFGIWISDWGFKMNCFSTGIITIEKKSAIQNLKSKIETRQNSGIWNNEDQNGE